MTPILVLALAVATLAAPQHEFFQDYHEGVGIPAAARIKAAESALDFDGARIVGGSTAGLGQFPYMGGLIITLLDGRTSVCGSSLISNTRLVTAAHCWRHRNTMARHLVVVLGSVALFSGGTRVTTNQVEMHPGYNFNNLNNDLAVIRINHVNYSNNINRIAMATGSNAFVGATAVAVGFGATSDTAGISPNAVLSHVSMRVTSNAECQQVYGSNIIASTICANGGLGRGTCGGDYGGPLVADNLLIGVASFRSFLGCGLGFPAGFARVSVFAPWIQARM